MINYVVHNYVELFYITNVKLSKMSKVSVVFDMAEIALVILILIKLF